MIQLAKSKTRENIDSRRVSNERYAWLSLNKRVDKRVNVNSYVTMLIDDRILDDPPGHAMYSDICHPLGLTGLAVKVWECRSRINLLDKVSKSINYLVYT